MAKEALMQFEGLVVEVLPGPHFRVKLDADHEIVAYTPRQDKEESDQTSGRRSHDYRNVPIQSGEGTIDLSAQA
jgi:hypothetical protein